MTLSPSEFLGMIRKGAAPLLDVRAPVEFWDGHVPEAVCAPILTNDERHLVGLRYKKGGQEAALALAHHLVNPLRKERVRRWTESLRGLPTPVLTCFRGGLRSATAQEWLRQEGMHVPRLEGGYKALRTKILEILERPQKGFILSGLTGSGKTELLSSLAGAIDLEGLAKHRGSSFGGWLRSAQPSQATFENSLGYALWRSDEPVIVESESRLIGRVAVPEAFFSQMRKMPRITLVLPQEERARRLTKEYVLDPLASFPRQEVERWIYHSLEKIKDRLGGVAHDKVRRKMDSAFAAGAAGEEAHEAWVTDLLDLYYDPLYRHSMSRDAAEVVFEGSAGEIRQEWAQRRTFTM